MLKSIDNALEMNLQNVDILLMDHKYREAESLLLNIETDKLDEQSNKYLHLCKLYSTTGELGKLSQCSTFLYELDYSMDYSCFALIYKLESEFRLRIKEMDVNLIYQLRDIVDMNSNSEYKQQFEFFYHYFNIIFFTEGIYDLKNAKEHLEPLEKLSIELNDDYYYMLFLLRNGIYYEMSGLLPTATVYYNLAIKSGKKCQKYYYMIQALTRLAKIDSFQGFYEKAIFGFQEALELVERLDSPNIKWSIKNELAQVHYLQGNTAKAIEMYTFCSEHIPVNDNLDAIIKAKALFEIVKICSEEDKMDRSEDALQKIVSLKYEYNTIFDIHTYYNLAQAMLFKNSNLIRKKFRALTILESIAFDPTLEYQISQQALISLCELHLNEYRQYEDPEILDEVLKIVDTLIKQSDRVESQSLQSYIYWIQANLLLIDGKYLDARMLIEKAVKLADEIHYDNLAHKLSNVLDALDYHLESESTEPFILPQNMNSYFNHNKRVERNDFPVIFFISNSHGSVLFKYDFGRKTNINVTLISGYLNAINSFGREVLATNGFVKRIHYQEYTILTEEINGITYTLTISGNSYRASKDLQKFVAGIPKLELSRHFNADTNRIYKPDMDVLLKHTHAIF